jgi:oligopeptide/dipeptide ABC transporter ATP-binding protein
VSAPLLSAEDLRVDFRTPGGTVRALDGVSLAVAAGETLALVGESGSGKSTMALTLMGVHHARSGRIVFEGRDITTASGNALKQVRRHLQMVLQDPYGSLDPRWTVERILAEPLEAHAWGTPAAIRERVAQLIHQVGLPDDALHRYPGQFSGGQRQRIAIARALALEPRLIIADEPVSALDVSIQAQIINLLLDIQRAIGLAYLVISHDIALVHQVANRVAVMYLGRVVEEGPADEVIMRPLHPYTVALVSAVPSVDPRSRRRRIVLPGEPPSPLDPPRGCAFHPRCPAASDRCSHATPDLASAGESHRAACFHPGALRAVTGSEPGAVTA